MTLESPHLQKPLEPTAQNIADLVASLPQKKAGERFAILTEDSQNYVQTLFCPGGFQLEHQDGSIAEHYHCTREDLSPAEIIEVFRDYLAGDVSWKRRFPFQRRDLRTASFRAGYSIGELFGRVASVLRVPKV